MARKYEEPKVDINDSHHTGDREYTITHPAYGMIRVSRPQGGAQEMFGSDLKHSSRVTITITRAEERRSLNTSWYHDRRELIEIDMTEHQWAAFVSSAGMSPVPCTLRNVPEDGFKLVSVPEILDQRNAKEKASKEFKDKIATHMDRSSELLNTLSDLVSSGKANKKQLLDLLGKANQAFGRFSSDAEFALECFEEEMEKIVENGRSEIEAHITNLATRTGMDVLKLRNPNESQRLEVKGE